MCPSQYHTCFGVVDLHDNVHTTDHLAKYRVLRWSGFIPEVQKRVMNSVQEELGTATVWLASVSLYQRKEITSDALIALHVGHARNVEKTCIQYTGNHVALLIVPWIEFQAHCCTLGSLAP